MAATEVALQLGDDFNQIRHFAKGFCVSQSVITFVRLCQTREFVGMSRPIKLATVDDATSYTATLSVEIFRRGVGHDVGSPFEGTAVHRCRERIVHHERHSVGMCKACPTLNVAHTATRVSDGFAKHQLRVGAESSLNFLVSGIETDKGTVDAHFLERYGKEVEGAAIDAVGGDKVVASIADVEHCEEVGSLSTRSEQTCCTTF